MMKEFMILDSRASYDIDDACVLECIGEVPERHAKKVLREHWPDQGAVLVSYEVKDSKLVNEQVVPT